MNNRKTKLEKALAFDDTRLQTSNEVVARGKLNPPNANARLAPLHAALIEAVEALEFYGNIDNWIDDKFRPREDVELSNSLWNDPSGKKAREALAKIDEVLEGMGGG